MTSRRQRARFEEDEKYTFHEHPRFSHATWVAVAVGGSAVLGAGVSMYGANKQAKANQSAADQNAQLQREQNNAAWTNWLMTRGIQPNTPVEAGVVPTAGNYKAVNTRLPLWANIRTPSALPGASTGANRSVPFLIKKGAVS